MFGGNGTEPAMGISRMVQHHDPHAGGGADCLHELSPIRQLSVGHGTGWRGREGVEVAGLGGHLVASDRGKLVGGAGGFLHGPVVGVMIVVGGYGELDAFPFGKPGNNPFILEIVHNEMHPGTENGWHTDVTWMEKPSLGSVAQCTLAPPIGGDTLFADSHAAFLGLPTTLQDRLMELSGIHDYNVFLNRGGVAMPDDLIKDLKAQIPFGVAHPIARTHPETHKLALYLHGGFLRHDSLFNHHTQEPLSASESLRITEMLLKQHSRPEYQCRFQWTEGAMAFWDNRAAQHYAVSDYYPHERHLRRVTISGSKPY